MTAQSKNGFDVEEIRKHFPFLQATGKAIHYLDNAASSQKPQQVLQRLNQCYESEYANVHRGVYHLSEAATAAFESVRKEVADFIGGVKTQEVIFTSGTTAAINLVARCWGESTLRPGDEIVLSVAEHHSNIVPWQMLAAKTGATVKFIPLKADLRLDLDAAKKLFGPKTRMLAVAHASNVLGIIHPLKELIAMAKAVGALTLIDGAQAIPHLAVNVLELDCDFYCFSSHKMLGPTGVGVLYGKEKVLEAMPPFFGGGEMIATVSTRGFTTAPLPAKFEAGTPPIAQVVGLGAAIRFLRGIDRNAALRHDQTLGRQALRALQKYPHVRLFCDGGEDWIGTVTFYHEKIHPHDMAAIQDAGSVCVRAGNHCAQPLMQALGVSATTRLSPYLYNNSDDIAAFLKGMEKAEKLFELETTEVV